MIDRFALDSNILIYLHDQDPNSHKRIIAQRLVVDSPVISPQVVSEYLNVCRKRLSSADCSTLYTEGMQHQMLVEKKLRIVNPFM